MKEFANKVAIVTGAASGIGKAIAEECIHRKTKVVLVDINSEKLALVQQQLSNLTSNVIAVNIDITNEKHIDQLVETTLKKFGEIHLLFNNAGIAGPLGPIWDVDIQEFKHLMECNFFSMVYALKRIVPIMLKQDNECHIINTASGAGFLTKPDCTGYHVSKHAVVELSETLCLDLQQMDSKVSVSLFSPGMTNTNFSEAITVKDSDSQEIKDMVSSFKLAMKEHGKTPDEIVQELFRGIEMKQFYIFPHFDTQKAKIEKRMQGILLRKNPELKSLE